jgi:hypothetical protein
MKRTYELHGKANAAREEEAWPAETVARVSYQISWKSVNFSKGFCPQSPRVSPQLPQISPSVATSIALRSRTNVSKVAHRATKQASAQQQCSRTMAEPTSVVVSISATEL